MSMYLNILNNLLVNLRTRKCSEPFAVTAKRLGIGSTYLKKIENGAIAQPNKTTIAKLAEGYGKEWEPVISHLANVINTGRICSDPSPLVHSEIYESLSDTIPVKMTIFADSPLNPSRLAAKLNSRNQFLVADAYIRRNKDCPLIGSIPLLDNVRLFGRLDLSNNHFPSHHTIIYDDVLMTRCRFNSFEFTASSYELPLVVSEFNALFAAHGTSNQPLLKLAALKDLHTKEELMPHFMALMENMDTTPPAL